MPSRNYRSKRVSRKSGNRVSKRNTRKLSRKISRKVRKTLRKVSRKVRKTLRKVSRKLSRKNSRRNSRRSSRRSLRRSLRRSSRRNTRRRSRGLRGGSSRSARAVGAPKAALPAPAAQKSPDYFIKKYLIDGTSSDSSLDRLEDNMIYVGEYRDDTGRANMNDDEIEITLPSTGKIRINKDKMMVLYVFKHEGDIEYYENTPDNMKISGEEEKPKVYFKSSVPKMIYTYQTDTVAGDPSNPSNGEHHLVKCLLEYDESTKKYSTALIKTGVLQKKNATRMIAKSGENLKFEKTPLEYKGPVGLGKPVGGPVDPAATGSGSGSGVPPAPIEGKLLIDLEEMKDFCTYCTEKKGEGITGDGLNKFKIGGKFYIITGTPEGIKDLEVKFIKIKDEPNVTLTDTLNGLIQKHDKLQNKKLGVINVDFTE